MYTYKKSDILERLKNIPMHYRFELKDLFEPWEWDRIEVGDRITLGRDFSRDVQNQLYSHIFDEASGKDFSVCFQGKSPQNQNTYEKICNAFSLFRQEV